MSYRVLERMVRECPKDNEILKILPTMIAIPFMSDPVLAAVAVVFGTLSVAVSVMCILFGLTFSTRLAT